MLSIKIPMRKARYFLTVLSFLFITRLSATWSIIVIDLKTKEIGIAGASCSPSVYGIGAIVPGKGAVVVQAASNSNARRKAVQMIMEGASPGQIIAAMKDPSFDPERQQYAVVCMNDKPETYTGSAAPASKGAITGKGISVQGNTLTSDEELQAVYNSVIQSQKEHRSIQEVLMIALEAGAKLGGDKRCGERKASSSFLTVFKPADNIQKPSINLVVYRTDDTIHAVEVLRKKFDEARATRIWISE
jgi:uncharacterized Ntn-hydrolase superfamily protein